VVLPCLLFVEQVMLFYQGVAVFHSALTQEKCNNNAASKKAFAGVSALVHFSLTPLIELACMHRSIQDTLICFLFSEKRVQVL
jgi:hypothetical protein